MSTQYLNTNCTLMPGVSKRSQR